MHVEIYTVRIKILFTGEEQQHLLCFEVGETDEDRNRLIEEFTKELKKEVNSEPYKLLGYVSKKIYPRED